MLRNLCKLTKVSRILPKYNFCNKNEKFQFSKEDIEILRQIYEKGIDAQSFEKHKDIIVEKVFKEREQVISFKLMGVSNIDGIFELYSQELIKQLRNENPEPPFSPNELTLFLYFTSCLRDEDYSESMNVHQERFQQITSQILLHISTLDPQQFCAFVWSLSTFQLEMGNLNLNEQKQFLIRQFTETIMGKIPIESLCPLAFSLKNILKDSNDIILKLSTLIQQNIQSQTSNNLITLIQCLPLQSFTNSKVIFEQLQYQYEQDLVTLEQYVMVLVELLRITQYEKMEFTNEMLNLLNSKLESVHKVTVQISMSKLVELILSLIPLQTQNGEKVLKQLLRICHSKSEKLNITEYISLFQAVAKIKHSTYININLEKTIKILIELSYKSQAFTLGDFEQKELIQIIVAAAALRIDNKDFIQRIINKIDPTTLLNKDLLLLAQAFVIYVRQFELEVLKIHSVCCKRKQEFNPLEQAQLIKTFNKIKILIPDSIYFK